MTRTQVRLFLAVRLNQQLIMLANKQSSAEYTA